MCIVGQAHGLNIVRVCTPLNSKLDDSLNLLLKPGHQLDCLRLGFDLESLKYSLSPAHCLVPNLFSACFIRKRVRYTCSLETGNLPTLLENETLRDDCSRGTV